jgi:hypothetical protein
MSRNPLHTTNLEMRYVVIIPVRDSYPADRRCLLSRLLGNRVSRVSYDSKVIGANHRIRQQNGPLASTENRADEGPSGEFNGRGSLTGYGVRTNPCVAPAESTYTPTIIPPGLIPVAAVNVAPGKSKDVKVPFLNT